MSFFKRLISYHFYRLLLCVCALSVFLCSSLVTGHLSLETAVVSRARFLMGTACEIEAWGDSPERVRQAIGQAFEEIARFERIMSTFIPESELSRVNREAASHSMRCSRELFDVLSIAERIYQETSGVFDVTYASTSPTHRMTLDAVRRSVKFSHPGVTVNLGGIGKGYALDYAAAMLLARGVKGARLNFGGQVLITGHPSMGAMWSVDVASPSGRRVTSTLMVTGGSVATSSNYQRAHVVDPRAGHPVGWQGSATVWAPTATLADAYSKPALILGKQKGLAWAERSAGLAVLYQEEKGSHTASWASRQWRVKEEDRQKEVGNPRRGSEGARSDRSRHGRGNP